MGVFYRLPDKKVTNNNIQACAIFLNFILIARKIWDEPNHCIIVYRLTEYFQKMARRVNIALRRFLHNHGHIATEGSLNDFKPTRVLYSAQYHRQYCRLQAFKQFGAQHMHNHDDEYPSRKGFEPVTSRLQAPVDMNEPSGLARKC